MFNNKKSDSTVDDVTFISAGIIFEGGVLSGTGSVRIDGTVTAKIDMHGELVIGETGVVTGDVFTESALVSGKIVGNVTCSAVLHLTST
ncbi:MAG: polymer-forming cytoskeletal protein, partial [Clostridiales bacterium]|nr:polymer-forming cytoskeletal protein [Clostridiales bacterium]